MDGVMIGSNPDLDSQAFATVFENSVCPNKSYIPSTRLSTSASKAISKIWREVLFTFQDVNVNEQCIPWKLI